MNQSLILLLNTDMTPTFTLPQACDSERGAARKVKIRAAIVCLVIILVILLTIGIYFGIENKLFTNITIPTKPSDLLTYVGITFFIIFISSLMYRETRKSVSNNNKLEGTIENERNILEQKIAERTQELITSEREKLGALQRTAQFGELSKGLFHDLMSPLTSVSLYLEQLQAGSYDPNEAQEIIKKVVSVSKRMNSFQESVHRTLGNETGAREINSNLEQEIMIVRDIVAYKARMAGVELVIGKFQSIRLKIHPVRLHQLLMNLVTNAIEACGSVGGKVNILVVKNLNETIIKISDNGYGMTPDQLNSIFKHQFTSKKDGHGIGLMTVKSIVENELHGTISVKSELGVGTEFEVIVPN